MEHINDKFLIDVCNLFTRKLLEKDIDIISIRCIMNEYQTNYIHIKELNFQLSQQFTLQMWWKTRDRI